MADRFVVAAPGTLFEALAAQLATWGRNTLRQRLRLGCIEVNGLPAQRHDQPVQVGDEVVVRGQAAGRTAQLDAARRDLPVLFADDDLCAIDKPAGLLSVSTDAEHGKTALAIVRAQLGRGRAVDLWPLHRLDRETSGVLLFARTRFAREQVQAAWPRVEKRYVAIVEGRPEPTAGVIDRPLWEDAGLRVHVGAHPQARPARTRYETTAFSSRRTQLSVQLDTGRKHQIRAHLAWLGHPVAGDDRYGGGAATRLCLHADRLLLPHPRDGRDVVLEAPAPPALAAELDRG